MKEPMPNVRAVVERVVEMRKGNGVVYPPNAVSSIMSKLRIGRLRRSNPSASTEKIMDRIYDALCEVEKTARTGNV
jgi:hypothetical protein